jgi:tetratricopeptide (TPR) repeat protein
MANVGLPRFVNLPRIVLLFAMVCILGMIGWIVSGRAGAGDHWREVARARYYLDRGESELAFQAVSGIRDDRPGGPEGLTLAARALLMHGSIAPARRVLEASLKMKAGQSDAAKMLAAIYLASGDGERGLQLLQQAAQFDPADYRPWYAMGKVHHDLGQLAESAEAYGQARRRSPPPAEAKESQLGRIRALLDAKRPNEAAEDLAEIRKQSASDPEVLALAARQAHDLGRAEEATALADQTLAIDPKNFDSLLVRARLHHVARSPHEALEDLAKAVQVKPNDVAALQLLLQVQTSLRMSSEAAQTQTRVNRARERVALMDQLTKMIHRHPNDPMPRYRMGQAALDGEMYVLAYQSFRAALDLDASFQPARDALDRLVHVKGFDYKSVIASPMQVMGSKHSLPR